MIGVGESSGSSGSAEGVYKRVRVAEPSEAECREKAYFSMMSNSLRGEIRGEIRQLFDDFLQQQQQQHQQQQQQQQPNAGEWDAMRLEQRTNAILSQATFLKTDGAKAQFTAFAKIKANHEVISKIRSGNPEAAVELLERANFVADVRLEVIERANRLPGGWPVATIFERMASASDAGRAKFNRLWKSACGEVDARKQAESKSFRGKSAYPRPDRGGRGSYSFRSVNPSTTSFFLCDS